MPHKYLFCLVILFAVALVACSSGSSPQPVQPAGEGGGGVIVVTSTPTPAPQVPDNIAIMPGATDLNVSESDISYVVKSKLEDVISFYQKEMVAKGWKEQEKPSVIGDFGRMYFASSDQQVSLLLNSSPSLNQVVVRISIITLRVVEPTPKP